MLSENLPLTNCIATLRPVGTCMSDTIWFTFGFLCSTISVAVSSTGASSASSLAFWYVVVFEASVSIYSRPSSGSVCFDFFNKPSL